VTLSPLQRLRLRAKHDYAMYHCRASHAPHRMIHAAIMAGLMLQYTSSLNCTFCRERAGISHIFLFRVFLAFALDYESHCYTMTLLIPPPRFLIPLLSCVIWSAVDAQMLGSWAGNHGLRGRQNNNDNGNGNSNNNDNGKNGAFNVVNGRIFTPGLAIVLAVSSSLPPTRINS
jgi:hypothetical protein